MRRPSIGRLMAMALAATVVCFLTIDTTMACRFLLRHRHFAPCTPVAPVECCDAVGLVVEVASPASCCGDVVVDGPVIHSESSCCGGEVTGGVVTPDMLPPAPPADLGGPAAPAHTDSVPTPADPPADTAPKAEDAAPADEAAEADTPAAPEVSEPAEAEESALPDADEPADETPLPGEEDAAPADDLPELDSGADTPAADGADAAAPAESAPAAESEDPLGGLDEETPADATDADPLGDLPAEDAADAATDAATDAAGDADNLDVLDDQTSTSPDSGNALGFREVSPVDAANSTAVVPMYREWTDNTGRFKTTARLVQVSNSDVRLLKESGRYTTVAKSRLSQSDLEYVEVMAKHLNKEAADQVASR